MRDSPMESGGESGIRTHVTGEPVNRISRASDAACRGRCTHDSARPALPGDPRKRPARGLAGDNARYGAWLIVMLIVRLDGTPGTVLSWISLLASLLYADFSVPRTARSRK